MSPIPHPAAAASGGKLIAPNLAAIAAEIVSHRGLVLVQAPAGYGKTVLAELLIEQGFAAVNPRRLAKKSAKGQAQIVVDDGCKLSIKELDTLAATASETLVITGRSLTDLEDWADDHAVRRYNMRRLELSLDDVLALTPANVDDKTAAWIHSVSKGWPALIGALLADIADNGNPPATLTSSNWFASGTHVRRLVDRRIKHLDAAHAAALGQLAHFSRFPIQSMVALIGADAVTAIRRTGMPTHTEDSGCLKLPTPVEAVLVADTAFSASTVDLVVPSMVTALGLAETASMLLNVGFAAEAATVLCSRPGARIEFVDTSQMAGLIRTLDLRLGSTRSDLMMRLAQVHHARAELTAQQDALTMAYDRAVAAGDEPAQFEAKLELVFVDPTISTRETFAELKKWGSRVETTLASQVRLREAEAAILGQGSLADLRASRSLLLDVAAEWATLGEIDRASMALRQYCSVPCSALGTISAGLAACEQGLALDQSSYGQARHLAMKIRQAGFGCDRDAHSQAETDIEAIGAEGEVDWILAYRAWNAMILASFDYELDKVGRYYHETFGLLGEILNHFTGASFYASAAECFAWCGDKVTAFDLLEQAITRRDEAFIEVGIAEVIVHACVGDPATVQSLADTLTNHSNMPAERIWQIDLARFQSELRRSGRQPSGEQAAATIRRARAQGCEQAVVERLRQMAGTSGSPSAIRIKLFGSFRITSSAMPLTAGKNTALVQYLAVAGQPVRTEKVIDDLWQSETGAVKLRKRLTNTVSRVRSELGTSSLVRKSDTLSLSGVKTDVAEFLELSAGVSTGTQALLAMELYSGHLVEDEVDLEWLDVAREGLRRKALGLVELLAQDPPERLTPERLVDMAVLVGVESRSTWQQIEEHSEAEGSRSSARRARQHLKSVI